MGRSIRGLKVYAAVIALLLVSLSLSGLAFAQGSQWIQGTPRFLAIPGGNPAQAMAESILGANVPLFTKTTTGGALGNFTYTMVGADPQTSNATTNIQVDIIPVKFKFLGGLGGKLSPTKKICNDPAKATAITRTTGSPLFSPSTYAVNGTTVGTNTGYIDAFQRANFWNFVGSTTPNYHTTFTFVVKPVQKIKVQASQGGTQTGPCANIGTMSIGSFDAQAQQMITNLGIPSTELPLFLSYNTFWTQGGCCILGYHSATNSNQTYAVAAYSDPAIFGPTSNIQDIHAMSHELGEWLDDPLINNIVPAWGHIGQVSGCQNNLEVGDPVTGNGFSLALNGKTYHVEDLVFLSWFARQTPSLAAGGFYSFTGSVGGAVQGLCH